MPCTLPQFKWSPGYFSTNFNAHTPILLPKGGDPISFHAQCILSTTSSTSVVLNTENLLILPYFLLKGGGLRMKKSIAGVVSCIDGAGSTPAPESKGLNSSLAHSNSIGAGRPWTDSAASDPPVEDIVSDPEVETLEQVVTKQFLRHIQKLMNILNTNTTDMQLVRWRLGLVDGTMKSLQETGELMGTDNVRVRLTERRIHRKLMDKQRTQDMVIDLEAETLERMLMTQLLIQELENLMNTLSPIERQIVKWRYGLEDGRMKTFQETGAIMGIEQEKVGQIERNAFLKSQRKKRTKDNVSDLKIATLEQVLTERLQEYELQKNLNTLNPKERQIVSWRYGLEDGRMKTLQEIGEKLGISRERVRQIESEAFQMLKIEKIKKPLVGYFFNSEKIEKFGGKRMMKSIAGVVSCVDGSGSTTAQESKGLNSSLAHSNSIGAERPWTDSAASVPPVEDIVSDPEVETLEQVVTKQFLRHMQKLINRLNTNTRDMQLVRWRLGLEDGTMKSLQETGELMAIDRSKIKLIENEILTRLKKKKTTKDIVIDLEAKSLEQMLMTQLLIQELANLMNTLSPIERQIVKWRYGLQDGRMQTLQETGAIMGIGQEKVRQIERTAFLKSQRKKRTKDNVSDLEIATLEQVLTERLQEYELPKKLNTLNPKKRQIVTWRYGLEAGRMMTLQEIGEKLGVTRERVRQLESRAFQMLKIEKLKKKLVEYFISTE